MVGLEISDHSLKFLELLKNDLGYKLGRFGEIALPDGTVVNGQLKDWKKLYELLLKLKNWSGFELVQVVLPDQLLDWQKETVHGVDDYRKVFLTADLRPRNFELASQALARIFLPNQKTKIVFLNLDDFHTSLGLMENNELVDLIVWPLGGELFNQHLKRSLNLDLAQARELKMSIGLDRARGRRQVLGALAPVVSVLRDEIEKQRKIWSVSDHLVLSGQQALIPGLPEYLSSHLDCVVDLANPWQKIFSEPRAVGELTYAEALRFGPVIGASLVEFV